MYLLDVNVWLALNLESHEHHLKASDWYSMHFVLGCLFCSQTQLAFLRLITNPKMVGDGAVRMDRAWQLHDQIRSNPGVGYVEEPAGLESILRSHTQSQTFSTKVWNDAYLAAFAIRAKLHLVTFDTGFRQYPGLNCTVLS